MEEKKKGSGLVIFLIIIIVLLASKLILLLMRGARPEGKEAGKTEKEVNEKPVREFSMSLEEANELLGYIPKSSPYGGYTYGDSSTLDMHYNAFGDKKVTVSDMNVNWLVHNTIKSMSYNTNYRKDISVYYSEYTYGGDEYLSSIYGGKSAKELEKVQVYGGGDCEGYKISDIKTVIEKKYGNVSVSFPEKVEGDSLSSCTKKDNYYICACPNGGYAMTKLKNYFGVVMGDSNLLVKYEKAEKDNSNIYLYVKVARADFKDDYKSFQLYKDGQAKELIVDTTFNSEDFYNNNSSKAFIDAVYEQYKDKMTTYKVTYASVGAHYTLTSVEPVK